MLLLDVPPEVFARVVAHLVTGAGISEAWKHRKACRKFATCQQMRAVAEKITLTIPGTFRRAIEFEALANQPTRAFLHTKETIAKKILRENAALYLSYRITAEKNAYSFVPRFLKRMLKTVTSSLPDTDHTTPRQYARTLCRLLIKEGGLDVKRLLFIKSPETSENFAYAVSNFAEDEVVNEVAAAAAVGNLKALRAALDGKPEQVWERSRAFEYPLAAAAEGGHTEVVGAIVKYFEHTHHSGRNGCAHKGFVSAIDESLRNRHAAVALLLLQIYHAYEPSVHGATFKRWFELALFTRNIDLIMQVRSLRQTDELDANAAFQEACVAEDLTAIRMFVEEGLVSLHCTASRWPCHDPLQTAVKTRSTKVVKLVLQLGSDPDGNDVGVSRTRPLWLAIENKDVDIVHILLDFGANPAYIIKDWKQQSPEFFNARVGIEKALVDALHRPKFFVRPTTPRTHFAADAQDLVLPGENDDTGTEKEMARSEGAE